MKEADIELASPQDATVYTISVDLVMCRMLCNLARAGGMQVVNSQEHCFRVLAFIALWLLGALYLLALVPVLFASCTCAVHAFNPLASILPQRLPPLCNGVCVEG